MNSKVTVHQINQLVDFIRNNYETFGTQKKNGGIVFDKLENSSNFTVTGKKTILPFKKIIFKDNIEIKSMNSKREVAFLGILNCDVWALDRFLEQFSGRDMFPSRKNFFILAVLCHPDDSCFCDKLKLNKWADFDLLLEKKGDEYHIFAKSKEGQNTLKKMGIKPSTVSEKEFPQKDSDLLDLKNIYKKIDNKERNLSFWRGIASQCFGCGACTAVCPLCFCTKQDFKNNFDGKPSLCMNWDSCFGKRFSEIQNRFDHRPTNSDRLYNWYHHKFVRAVFENKNVLCVGCGRCIDACPANLNIVNILNSLLKQEDEK